ncbi:MAG TPA: zinc-ribbon domain-containing protein [Pyrinomonadaceae bacterium]|nr:zinc-ribbon domain-containing protein [Pyrinomonadaceae bacterium]
MSEPEIARRCTSCGVSVRERAMFCPQCGNPIPEVPVTTVTPAPQPPPEPRQQPDAAKGRIEKLRHVSSVVIDQAAYDPSLRFLLVAAAFFILFLVLLILSKFIG